MSSRLTVLVEFSSRLEAEVARASLAGEGVDSVLSADDLGGLHPQLGLTSGVRLMVREDDLPLARRILAGSGPAGS